MSFLKKIRFLNYYLLKFFMGSLIKVWIQGREELFEIVNDRLGLDSEIKGLEWAAVTDKTKSTNSVLKKIK